LRDDAAVLPEEERHVRQWPIRPRLNYCAVHDLRVRTHSGQGKEAEQQSRGADGTHCDYLPAVRGDDEQ
jgi:hypothetical protein